MSRYIDADKAYETARNYHKDFARSIADLTSLREVLVDTPTADVVEVVQCKDCKHCVIGVYTNLYCEHYDYGVNADDFCSYGERKDEE